ncbi:MAG: Na+/H+ antiporter NhaA, partial [Proteobacteria bacterium]
CTLFALIIANSPLGAAYDSFFHLKVGPFSLQHWINDGLMVVFFFVVGMEIKRELVEGELSSFQQAVLPFAAAVGGMVGPALIYLSLNHDYPFSRGWGIPMATDIAFAVAALSIFAKRVPAALKIFLLALAIVDDLGAVVVIALFYTNQINAIFLLLAAAAFGLVFLLRRIGVGHYAAYVGLGILMWAAVLGSGVHATIAGVLMGLATPLKFGTKARPARHPKPLDDLLHRLHPWVSFAIMPAFALANAGVRIVGVELPEPILSHGVFLGVSAGLLLGKPIGILLVTGLCVALRLGKLPRGVGWFELFGVALLAGIGFTMALFISNLALYPEQEIYSKAGILLASTLAAVAGVLVLHFALPNRAK